MGNIVLTANWEPSNNDDEIKESLKTIALRYNVETNVHPNMGKYIKGYSQFSVEIGGLSIHWNGGHSKCMSILNKISEKWNDELSDKNIRDVKITIDNLPM